MNTAGNFPAQIPTGCWRGGHIQGIALDPAGGYIYYSYTTVLVKADLQGRVIGTVEGLLGHLGCIDFNDEDGRIYGSLELKHDAIGQGIMDRTGIAIAPEDAFYIAIFRGDRICRVGMDAERDGIMTAVYLPEVAADHAAAEADGRPHRYGCSGIDGTGIGPIPGSAPGSPSRLLVAYGIYRDAGRQDNDHQVLLCLDWRKLGPYEQPLTQGRPHHSGPRAEARFFLYTGNTTYGIQNLEYDPHSGDWLVSVYPGVKPEFSNFPLFVIDGSQPPRLEPLRGRRGEQGLVLRLKREAAADRSGLVWGLTFPRGQTGLCALGDGRFYVSHEARTPDGAHTATVRLYRRTEGALPGFAAEA